MAISRHRGSTGKTHHGRILPPRTPGILGINDAGDPSALASFGDTPGPLGIQDGADPAFRTCYATEAFQSRDATAVVSPISVSLGTVKPLIAPYAIPQPSSAKPPLLLDSDISKAAKTLGVEPAAIYAVSKVESGGRTGFDDNGRPKILFEARWFHKFTNGKYDKSHPHLSQASWAGARKYYRSEIKGVRS